MGVNLPFATNYPASIDAFPTLADGIHTVLASHPNSLATAIENIEAILGVTGSAVTTSVDYILRQGRHVSARPGGNTGSIAYILDTLNAHTGTDLLLSLRSAGTERFRVEAEGDLIVGAAGSGIIQLGTTDINKRIIAEQAAAGDGEIRYNATTNQWELSNDGGAFSAISAGGGGSDLQTAYDAGSTIVTDATGMVAITHGALAADGDLTFRVNDADANTGRTAYLVEIRDANATDGLFSSSPLHVVRTTSNNTVAVFEYSLAGAFGPEIQLYHSEAASAANDAVGILSFWGRDSAGTRMQYARIQGVVESPTAGDARGKLDFYVTRLSDFGSRRVLELSGRVDGVGEVGAIFTGRLSTGSASLTIPAFTFRVTDDFLVNDAILMLEKPLDGVMFPTAQFTGTGGYIMSSNVDDGTTVSPILQVYRNRFASGASVAGSSGDILGEIEFYGNDSGTTKTKFAGLRALATDATNTSEDGELVVRITNAATDQESARFQIGALRFPERAAIFAAPGAGFGTFWVRNDTPSVPMFTDDAGTDHVLGFGGGGGGETLQQTYDLGATITTDATSTVALTRGASTPDAALMSFADANVVASRTAALVSITDQNNGTGASLYVTRSTASGVTALFESTINDATTVGPVLDLYRNRGVDQVDADILGELRFSGLDDGTPSKTTYAAIRAIVLDSGDASEDGALAFRTMTAGTEIESLRIVGVSSTSTQIRIGGTTIFSMENASPSVTIPYIIPSIRIQDSGTGLLLLGNSSGATTTSPGIHLQVGTQAITAGNQVGIQTTSTYAPTSGTGTFQGERISMTVNQTGGANGQVTAHRIEVTETAVVGSLYLADWLSAGNRKFAVTSAGVATIQNQVNGATGPMLELRHVRTNDGQANDEAGRIQFWAMDDGTPTATQYGEISTLVTSPTDTAETGRMVFSIRSGASLHQTFIVESRQMEAQTGTQTNWIFNDGLVFERVSNTLVTGGTSIVMGQFSENPTADDVVAALWFRGYNDNTPQDAINYAEVLGLIANPVTGDEGGRLIMRVMVGGAPTPGFEMLDDTGVMKLGFFNGIPSAQPVSGADLTNNVTSGGTDNTIDNWTNLSVYATDAAAIRNAIYQLSRKLKQLNDGLRDLSIFT